MSAELRVKSFIDRILRLKEEQDALADDIREVYAEAKGEGFDKTAMGQLVAYLRKREKDGDKLAEQSAIFDLYLEAYERPSHAHTREDRSYAEEKGRGDIGIPISGTGEIEAREKFIEQAGGIGAALSAVLGVEVEMVPAGKLTDQKSDQPHGAVGLATAAVASDEMAAQDDVGATASSTNSPNEANEVPAQDGGGSALDASHGGKSNAARPASVDAHVNDGRLAGEVSAEVVTVVGNESGTLTNPNPAASSQPVTAPQCSNSSRGTAATSSDDEPFEPAAFLRQPKPLRPDCLHPENCAGYGAVTCHGCKVAARAHEVVEA